MAYNDPHLREYLDSSDWDSRNRASGPLCVNGFDDEDRVRVMKVSSTEAKVMREVLEQGSTYC